MTQDNKIIRVTKENWNELKWFLGYGMKEEFPIDEQLSLEQLQRRVFTPIEHDGNSQHIVNIIQGTEPDDNMDNRGFIIYHIYKTISGPFALIEYTAGVGTKNKRLKYGSRLVDEAKKILHSEGVEQIVLETELVPRIIETPVHDDLNEFDETYTKTGNLWTISKGVARWDGVDQRNHFWENMGFGIIPDIAYCQPDLCKGLVEKRVPLDLQIGTTQEGSITQVSVDRVIDILKALAEHNYNLGMFSDQFVEVQTAETYSGRNIAESSVTNLTVMPYSQLQKKPEVIHAMRMYSLQSRYQS